MFVLGAVGFNVVLERVRRVRVPASLRVDMMMAKRSSELDCQASKSNKHQPTLPAETAHAILPYGDTTFRMLYYPVDLDSRKFWFLTRCCRIVTARGGAIRPYQFSEIAWRTGLLPVARRNSGLIVKNLAHHIRLPRSCRLSHHCSR